MNPKDHIVEVEVPEVEVCIDCSTAWDPCAESCGRPSDHVVKHAVEDLVAHHYEELVDICTRLHVIEQEEVWAANRYDRLGYHEGKCYG